MLRSIRSARWTLTAFVLLHAPGFSAPASGQSCSGDCNRNGEVEIFEIVIGVNILLGLTEISACAVADSNRDGRIDTGEFTAAVDNSLNGCGAVGAGVVGGPGGPRGSIPQPEIEIVGTTISPGSAGEIAAVLREDDLFGVVATLNDLVLPPQLTIPEVAVQTLLVEDLAESATSLRVQDASRLPDFGVVQIDEEQLLYSSKDGDTLLVAARGEVPTSHVAGANVTVPRRVPDCTPSAELGADANKTAVFAYLPDGCAPGVDCEGVRAFVGALDNLDLVSVGTQLYSCRVEAGGSMGDFLLRCPEISEFPFEAAEVAPFPGSSLGVLCADATVGVREVPLCQGDSNFDGVVDVAELVNCQFEFVNREASPACDEDGNGLVTLGEVGRAFINDLFGCVSQASTATDGSIRGRRSPRPQ